MIRHPWPQKVLTLKIIPEQNDIQYNTRKISIWLENRVCTFKVWLTKELLLTYLRITERVR